MNYQMKIKVNGELKNLNFDKHLTLEETIKILGYKSNTVVVELNNLIINSKYWGNQFLKEGDKLEIVSIVGGG